MNWSKEESANLYGIENWGSGYFCINDEGHVQVSPEKNHKGLDLHKLTKDLIERGIRAPILVRFPDLVKSRINLISDCFNKAIKEYNYEGEYAGVYPIKVNQQRHLVEEIINFGKDRHLGLECGSKPELLITLAFMESKNSYIICNGFKDSEYIETALLSQKLGHCTFLVIDRIAELSLIIEAAKKLNIRPKIGLRVKLNTQGSGRWTESSGAKSKFGITPSEIMQTIDTLRAEDMLDCIELLHFHIGSQIPSIQHIKGSIKEAARFFVELSSYALNLKYIDVGGGLGVDYDGSGKGDSSMNYSEQEYANDVVSMIQSICDEKNTPHPNIISESGRALVAHSSVLLFDVLGINEVLRKEIKFKIVENDHSLVKEIHYILEHVNLDNLNEFYNDLIEKKTDCLQMFSYGTLSLAQRAKAEDLYWACATKMNEIARDHEDAEDIYWNLQKELSDTYFCNFSIFQSLPDSWAVKQVFPVMPIHRLLERPDRRATLVDLTCDSDGKIDKFIDTDDGAHQSYIDIHSWKAKEAYYIGVFLTGAYQEILGDLHNLFGDTDTVHVSISENGSYNIEHVLEGDTVAEVLSYLHYSRPEMMEKLRKQSEMSIQKGSLSLNEAHLLRKNYEEGLAGYTYLE